MSIAVIYFDRHRTMDADAQVAPVAALVADATRASVLWALSDGRALPACDLALQAGVTAATISYQLEKLIAGGLVAADRRRSVVERLHHRDDCNAGAAARYHRDRTRPGRHNGPQPSARAA